MTKQERKAYNRRYSSETERGKRAWVDYVLLALYYFEEKRGNELSYEEKTAIRNGFVL